MCRLRDFSVVLSSFEVFMNNTSMKLFVQLSHHCHSGTTYTSTVYGMKMEEKKMQNMEIICRWKMQKWKTSAQLILVGKCTYLLLSHPVSCCCTVFHFLFISIFFLLDLHFFPAFLIQLFQCVRCDCCVGVFLQSIYLCCCYCCCIVQVQVPNYLSI